MRCTYMHVHTLPAGFISLAFSDTSALNPLLEYFRKALISFVGPPEHTALSQSR